MSLTVSYSPSSAFRRVPAGQWPARCDGVIDLGTQMTQFAGEDPKAVRQLMLQFSVYGEDEQGVPLTVEHEGREVPLQINSRRLTLSMNEKSTLRKLLKAWRGRDFTPEELKGFTFSKLAGAPCLLNVIHEERNGKTYANIQDVTPLPALMKKSMPASTVPLTIFDFDNFDAAVFDGLSEYVQGIIKESAEFKSRKPPAQAAPAPAKGGASSADAFSDLEDDVPFITASAVDMEARHARRVRRMGGW